MIRKTTINISNSNIGKKNKLDVFFVEAIKVINLFIDELWINQDFSSKFVDFKVDSWLSARMQQNLGKQALEIVKSQRKRKNKIKPIFNKKTIELDQRFVDIQFDSNSFDVWVKIGSIGNKIIVKVPGRKHKHFNKFKGWIVKKSIKLKKIDNNFFIDIYFNKENPKVKKRGKSLGIDIGYKKLIVTSEKQFIGKDFEKIYEKIARKKQGSNAFKKSLIERDDKINEIINKELNISKIKSVIVENLKSVKHKSKFSKKFNNKCQRWSYPKVLEKLSRLCEESGVLFTKVNPAYTSQKCSKCGVIDKKNRKGEIYQCACGNRMDADYNAAINISHLGVYSPQALN